MSASLSPLLCLPPDLRNQVVHLALDRPDIDLRVQKPRRPNDLLGAQHLMPLLIRTGRCGHEQDLVDLVLKLLEFQRTVVKRTRKTESIIDQRLLPASVAVVHRIDLRQRHVGLVDDDQKLIREIIHQRLRRRTRFPAFHMAGIVLDAGAETSLIFHALLELRSDALCRFHNLVLRHHIVRCRKDSDKIQFPPNLAGERIDLADPVDLVSEKLHPVRIFIRIGRKNVEGIPLHSPFTRNVDRWKSISLRS